MSGSDDLSTDVSVSRRIRSFVRREGRTTRAQQRALAEWWGQFGVEAGHSLLESERVFGRRAPLVMEIGFGDGESLAAMAMAHPEFDYLAIEIHRPGIGRLLLRLAALGLTNVRVICADAVDVLERQLPDQCLDRVQIFFPDPWPKTRHHKRRLIQAPFVTLLARKLKPAGQLQVATDCEQYARAILDLLNHSSKLVNVADGNGFAPRPVHRPPTKFERRGRRLGHDVWDLLFVKAEDGE